LRKPHQRSEGKAETWEIKKGSMLPPEQRAGAMVKKLE
jgi:hypothetical protein